MTRSSALPIVRTIVAAKIANSRVVLLRAAREIVDETRENGSARRGEPSLLGRLGSGYGQHPLT